MPRGVYDRSAKKNASPTPAPTKAPPARKGLKKASEKTAAEAPAGVLSGTIQGLTALQSYLGTLLTAVTSLGADAPTPLLTEFEDTVTTMRAQREALFGPTPAAIPVAEEQALAELKKAPAAPAPAPIPPAPATTQAPFLPTPPTA